jgi:hypothetical protein
LEAPPPRGAGPERGRGERVEGPFSGGRVRARGRRRESPIPHATTFFDCWRSPCPGTQRAGARLRWRDMVILDGPAWEGWDGSGSQRVLARLSLSLWSKP